MGPSRSLAAERCLVQKKERPGGRKTNEATGKSAGLVQPSVIGPQAHSRRKFGKLTSLDLKQPRLDYYLLSKEELLDDNRVQVEQPKTMLCFFAILLRYQQ